MSEQLLSRRVEKLEKLFDLLNAHLFEGKLQPVVITISPDTTKGAYGWFTVGKRWSTGTEDDAQRFHEINICAEWCNRPIKAIVATLIHEMVHLFCSQNGIKDTSNRGNYHNSRFAAAAKEHGGCVRQVQADIGVRVEPGPIRRLPAEQVPAFHVRTIQQGGRPSVYCR